MADTILIVEDEESIAGLIELYLQNEGYRVLKAYTGAKALAQMDKEPVDLVILDLMLPDMNGFDVCRRMRESHTFPIIMLTSMDEATDKITGLTLGADDYVTKPFLPLELMARVKAQLRRHQKYDARGQATGNVVKLAGIAMDSETHTCTLEGRPISLTPTEFSILWMLCSRPGQPVSSEELFRGVWGEAYYEGGSNTVMVHIRHLREKLGDSAEEPKYIKTVWGVGYKIEG